MLVAYQGMPREALVEPSTGSTTATSARSGWCAPLSSDTTPSSVPARTSSTARSAVTSMAYWPGRVPAGRQSSTPCKASGTASATS